MNRAIITIILIVIAFAAGRLSNPEPIIKIVPSEPPVTSSTSSERRTADLWRVTAYCSGSCCCGRFADGITASGKPATGMIIAAPPEIPFGTQIYIKGWGWGEVKDRGGSIKGKRLDLLFPTHGLALQWGVRYLEIRL